MLVWREENVRLPFRVYEGHIEFVYERQCLRINIRAATDMDFFVIERFCNFDCLFETSRHGDSLILPRRIARDDDIRTPWEGPLDIADDGFECFPPHDDRMPHRKRLKPLQIVRNMPQKLAVLTELAILPYRHNGAYSRLRH